jgi:alkylation response protein AidB-like acyl-CoA dehydrogenase
MNAALTWAQIAQTLAVEFAARASENDLHAQFPHQNFHDLQQAGLLALASPRELGGPGASLSQLAEVIAAIGQGDPATGLVLIMQYIQHRNMRPDLKAWPTAIAQGLVHASMNGLSLINALRVEPELGSPARGGLPNTIARRTPEGTWVLNGHKLYCTGSPILSWYAVWARTDEAHPRVGNFLVKAGLPGTRIVETWDHLGLRASGSHDIIFENVVLPADAKIDLRTPEEWVGYNATLVADMSVLMGALYTGVARAARDWVVDFLNERKPSSLGAALSTLPRAQEIVGKIEAYLATNQRLIESTARDIDAGQQIDFVDSGLLKAITTNNAVEATQAAISLSSNHGISRKNPLERHLRDVLCGRIHTPQDDSVYVAAGRRALAL